MDPALPTPTPVTTTVLLSFGWDRATTDFTFTVNAWLVLFLLAALIALVAWRWNGGPFSVKAFEIDEAEIGVGNSKLRFRPNLTDRQVAYAIWVELSTRKIGLPIDLEHDVISEIYDSWYTYFSVTRDLIKSIPISQVKRGGTQAIIKLSIVVLNEGLRPHLTRWQARYRAWYDRELKRYGSRLATK
jgi:hypothetical protein